MLRGYGQLSTTVDKTFPESVLWPTFSVYFTDVVTFYDNLGKSLPDRCENTKR